MKGSMLGKYDIPRFYIADVKMIIKDIFKQTLHTNPKHFELSFEVSKTPYSLFFDYRCFFV